MYVVVSVNVMMSWWSFANNGIIQWHSG